MSDFIEAAYADLYSPVSFSGGGKSRKGNRASPRQYSKKDGNGGAVEYQNTMRSVGWIYTQDYAGQQAEHWRKSSETVGREMGSYASFATGVVGGAVTGGLRGAIVGGVTLIAGKFF